MSDRWYALNVKPRFEKYARTHLEDKGYAVFLPTYTATRVWSDRVKSVTLPLFPGYIFCQFDVNARLPILVTPGVNYVVGVGKSPVAVEESELSSIRRVMESGMATLPWPYLQIGDTARIEAGPLEGLTGIVTRLKGSYRLVVSVSLLMRSVSVELDRTWIKPTPVSSPDLVQEHAGLVR